MSDNEAVSATRERINLLVAVYFHLRASTANTRIRSVYGHPIETGLVHAIEGEFGVEISDDETEEWVNVRDIYETLSVNEVSR